MLSEYYHDHTVRPPEGRDWLSDSLEWLEDEGPDLAGFEGSSALAKRLTTYWALRGERRTFVSIHVGTFDLHGVYGVRDVTEPEAPKVRVVTANPALRNVGPTPRQQVKALVREVLKEHPKVSYEALMRFRRRKSGRVALAESIARAECIRAVKARFDFDYEQLARIFGVHRTTVLLALGVLQPRVRVVG